MQNDERSRAFDIACGYLKASLPLADRLMLDDAAIGRVAQHALDVREAAPWGADIPEDLFQAYVLFPRVNNEDPQFYHEPFYRALKDRIAGMTMVDAALEINRWCYEQATYRSTDGRTANALTVARRGFGRCGEESTLLVSALRACGLPARQLYAPWWAHCDDNHAWVEVWTGDGWHYMGACEPEPTLDSGWFTAAASKAMLIHTRAWGVLPEGERAERRVGEAYIVNRTAAYARTRLLTVQVIENGTLRSGLRVFFEIANMAAWRTLCEKTTDATGIADLLVGLGTLRVRVTDGQREIALDVDAAVETHCLINFAEAIPHRVGTASFAQRAPIESRMEEGTAETDARWLEAAAEAREARFAVPEGTDALVRTARGNGAVIEAFLADARFDPDDARALVMSLREKDLADVTLEVLEDAMLTALPYKDDYPRDAWVEGVLCPRVGDEMLTPSRRKLAKMLEGVATAEAVWEAVRGRTGLCAMTPEGLTPDFAALLEGGWCDADMRSALFVAAARAIGIAARLDPVTGVKQVWIGGWRVLLREDALSAHLTLVNGEGRPLEDEAQFTFARFDRGDWRIVHAGALDGERTLDLLPGDYRAMTALRQIDGGIEGREQYLHLESGDRTACTLTLPEERIAEHLMLAPLTPMAVCRGGAPAAALPAGGQPAIVALIAPGQEPTEHFLNELVEAAPALMARNIAVELVVRDPKDAAADRLRVALAAVPGARLYDTPDETALREWRKALRAGERRFPLAVAVDRRAQGRYATVNYNVGSVKTLIRVLEAAEAERG